MQIVRAADGSDYAILAYCVMPDHVHVVVAGRPGASRLTNVVKRMKQLSGYHAKMLTECAVWQTGYHDTVLRSFEATRNAIAYVINNPVRAGLVANAADYEFIGSSVYSRALLLDFAKVGPTLRSGV